MSSIPALTVNVYFVAAAYVPGRLHHDPLHCGSKSATAGVTVITFFTSGPDTITFPIKVYSMVRFSVTPAVNAASTLLILLTAGLTALALWLQGADIAKQAA
jgi:hypothetical protein